MKRKLLHPRVRLVVAPLLVLFASGMASAPALAAPQPENPLNSSGCNGSVCIYVQTSCSLVTDWQTTAYAATATCTHADFWANGVLKAETGTQCVSAGTEVQSAWKDVSFSAATMLANIPGPGAPASAWQTWAVAQRDALNATSVEQTAQTTPSHPTSPAIPDEPPPSCGDHVQVRVQSYTSTTVTLRVVATDMTAFMPPHTYGLVFISGNGEGRGGYNVSADNGANFAVTFDTTQPVSGAVSVTM